MNNNRLTSPCYWKAQNRKIQSVCGGWLGGKPNPVNVAWHRRGFIDLGIAPFTGGIWECRDAGLTSHCCSWRILLLLSFSWINAQWNLRLHQQNGPSLTLRLGFNREGSHSLSWRIIVKPFKMKSVLIWESFGKKKHMKISHCGLTRRQMLFLVPLAVGKGGRTECFTLNDWARATDSSFQECGISVASGDGCFENKCCLFPCINSG